MHFSDLSKPRILASLHWSQNHFCYQRQLIMSVKILCHQPKDFLKRLLLFGKNLENTRFSKKNFLAMAKLLEKFFCKLIHFY